MGRGAYLARTKGGYDRPSKPSGSGGGGWSPSVGGGGGSQKNNQTGQSDSNKGEHKLLTQLKNISAQGKGNTAQARYLENYLSRVKDPDTGGNLLSEYYKSVTPTQIKQYQEDPSSTLPEGQWLDIDGKKVWSASPFAPGQFSKTSGYNKYGIYSPGSQYADVAAEGIRPTNLYGGKVGDEITPEQFGQANRPTGWMDFGFGSVFGTSSASTASSPAVQESLETMMDQLYDQGYSPDAAKQIAMEKMYPGYIDYAKGEGPIPTNFMDMNIGAPLPGHKMTKDTWQPNTTSRYGVGGGGGGWGGYGGYGGGGGGGYGWGLQQDPMQRGYQREIVGPGTLQEQVNQLYLGMGTPQQSNPQRFSRGGIVSLLRLN